MGNTAFSTWLVLTLCTFAWAGPATITVTAPELNAVLCTGKTYSILWTSSGVAGRVKVELITSGGIVQTLARETDNSGKLRFAVPNRIDVGRYTVAVSSLDGRVRGISQPFRIEACLLTSGAPTLSEEIAGRVTLVFPNNPHVSQPIGGYLKVSWNTMGRLPSAVNISLHPADRSGPGRLLDTARTGSKWKMVRIPPAWETEGVHAIRVGAPIGTPGGLYQEGWGQLHLYKSYLVTYPRTDTVWRQGERVYVTWRRIGSAATSSVNISLIDKRAFDAGDSWPYRELLASPDTGLFRFTLREDIPPGAYFVTVGEIRQGEPASGTFQIVAR